MLLHNLKKKWNLLFLKSGKTHFWMTPLKGSSKFLLNLYSADPLRFLKETLLRTDLWKKTDVIPTCKVKWNLGGCSPDYYIRKFAKNMVGKWFTLFCGLITQKVFDQFWCVIPHFNAMIILFHNHITYLIIGLQEARKFA